MNYRRILGILLFIGVTIGIGYALWSLFFRGIAGPQPAPNENVNGAPISGGLEPAVNGVPVRPPAINGPLPGPSVSPIADGGLTAVTPIAPVATVGASISSNGNLSYYDRSDEKFYRIGADGTVQALSGKQFHNVKDAVFDPNGRRAIISYPDGSKISYDFNTGTQVTLPKHWEDFDFSRDGEQFVTKSIGLDPEARFLVISNPDGSGARPIQELGENQNKVKVAFSPTGQVVATATMGTRIGLDRQEVYLIGQNQENFKSLVVQGLDFRPKWTPAGDRLLYSVANSTDDWRPRLWIVDAQGDDIGRNRRSLSLNTWADKCAFADDQTLYCAAAPDLPEGAGLNQAAVDNYADEFYRVDLESGLVSRVAQPEGSHTVGKIMVSPDASKLYFTDKATGVLNQLKLK